MTELNPVLYTIAWIAPLEIEAQAALHMMDNRHHGRFPVARGDDYVFLAGDIGGHKIIIATLPAGQEYGTGSAAALASQVKKFFPNLWFGLLVGVASGLPSLSAAKPRDIRLGDVLVALPEGDSAGLIAYDLGKETGKDGFRLLHFGHVLATTETVVRSAIRSIKLNAPDDADVFLRFYNSMKDKEHDDGTFADPGQENDVLYETDKDGIERVATRDRRLNRRTRVWYGPIGSGEKLIKDARKRNELRDKYNIIGLEMEAAGTMNRIPVGVIRGVCDYGDQHKNKEWQPYAAAMAAAYAKSILFEIPPRMIQTTDAPLPPKPLRVLPFGRNKDFIGRQSYIDWLITKLYTENKKDGCLYAALSGLGGVGKTNIALELAFRLQEKSPDYSVFWVQASDEISFENSYREIGRRFQIPELDDEKADIKQLVYKVVNEIQNPWLIVVDNADDSNIILKTDKKTGRQILFESLPNSHNGAILFTTRNDKAATDYAGTNVMTVKEMDDLEAKELLKKSLRNQALIEDKASTARLLTLLYNIPLAIKQAAAFLNKNKTTIAKYLSAYEKTNEDFIESLSIDFEDNWRYRGMKNLKNPIATTWFLSFEQICQQDPLAAEYMAFMSCIHDQDIPEDLLPQAAPGKVLQALGTLHAFAFIKKRPERESYDMHGLVHLVMQNWLKTKDQWTSWKQKSLRQVSNVFPWPRHENRAMWTIYLPHVLCIIAAFKIGPSESRETLVLLQRLLHNLGECFAIKGQYTEAGAINRQTLHLKETVLGKEHPDTLASMNNLASSLRQQGKYAEAEVLDRQALQLMKTMFGKEHPSTLASMNNLASSLRQQGKYTEAEVLHRQTLHLRETVLGKEHPDTLASINNLASSLDQQGKYIEAEVLDRQTLHLSETVLGKEHPYTLTSLNNLAISLDKQGRYTEAEVLHRQTLQLKERVLGKEHPDTLRSINNLANLLYQQGKYTEAEVLHRQTLHLRETALGKEHPDTLASINNLASSLYQQGKYAEAETIKQQADFRPE